MLAVVLAMLRAVCCVFAACGEGDKTPGGNTDKPGPSIDKNQNITSVYGTYTRFLGYEDLKDVFSTQISAFGTDDSNFLKTISSFCSIPK